MEKKTLGKGVVYAVAAYVLWGILPVYWKLLSPVNSFQILGFRIIFSLFFTAAILLARRNTTWIGILSDPRRRFLAAASAFMITVNWGVYIWAVNAGHTVECSLGYYINPLVSVLLGLIFYRERLLPLQWAAFGLAAAGVGILTAFTGVFPWTALALAFSFAFYGLFKKKLEAGALDTLGTETLLAAPAAILLLVLPGGGLNGLREIQTALWIPIALSGFITVTPLFCFAHGAKRLPLSTLGFLQFINPTFQFLTGVFVFREPFPRGNIFAFILIWTAILLYSASFSAFFTGRKPDKAGPR
jgi:chloramphenicol-sensitive protein RarD